MVNYGPNQLVFVKSVGITVPTYLWPHIPVTVVLKERNETLQLFSLYYINQIQVLKTLL